MRQKLAALCVTVLAALVTISAQQQAPSTSNTADMRIWGKNAAGAWVPVVLDASGNLPSSTTAGDAGSAQQAAPSTSGTVDARLWAKNAAGVYVPVVLDSSGRLPTTTTVTGGDCSNTTVVNAIASGTAAPTCVTITSAFVNTTVWTGTATSGLLKASSQGVLAAATSGTDYAAITWQPPVNLRLSLTTNVFVTTTDVTAAATIYWTPSVSGGTGVVTGYTGTALARKTVTQQSLALGTINSGANYNVYYDYDGAVLALGAVWTNDTTPSETLADESGASVLSSDHTKLYLGVIRTTATTTTEDSLAKRFVWNAYNQSPRVMKNATETTDSWVYTTATWRQANANAANQLAYVTGSAATVLDVTVLAIRQNSTANKTAAAGVGVDSTSVNTALLYGEQIATASTALHTQTFYKGLPGVGYHYLAWLEYSEASGTATWFGDAGDATRFQSGIVGTIWN